MGVYLMGLMYSGVIMLPATVVYWITAPLTLGTVIGPVVMTVVISVFRPCAFLFTGACCGKDKPEA